MRWLLGLLILSSCAKHDAVPISNPGAAGSAGSAGSPPAAPVTTPVNTPDPGGLHGSAELSPVHGVSTIAARFEVAEVNGHDVELKGAVTGLTPGTYVLHYHAPTGCDPMAGDPQDKHLGDLGTIHPDPSGAATVTFTIKDARLGGMHPITDTCLAIYAADGVTVLSYGHIFGRALGIGH